MCRSIKSSQIALQERICKSRKPFLAVEFSAIKNTVILGKRDLAVFFSLPFCDVSVMKKHHKNVNKEHFMVQNNLKINTMKTEKTIILWY